MNNTTEVMDPNTGEIMQADAQTTSLAGTLAKAEIDQQIATAHQFPRSLAKVSGSMKSLATFSDAAAAECNYAMPRSGKSLTGPSIRLAEIVVSQYGNCRVGARVVHVDRFEKFLEAEGIFHDLESNSATTARVRRKISDKKGRLYNDDMITMTGNAACSIAKRNAVLAAVPKALWMPAYDAAMEVIKGNAKTLTERREGAIRALGAFGVTPDMLFEALGIEGVEEISIEHMPALVAMHTSLKNEEQTVESLFPRPAAKADKGKGEAPKGTADKLADIAKGGKKKADKKTKAKAAPKGEDKPSAGGDTISGVDTNEEPQITDVQASNAYDRGKKARFRGMKKDACPEEIKKAQRLFDCWEDGWADMDEELEK